MNELAWIEYLRSRVPSSDCVGVGDDAAVLPNGKIVSTDTFVEGIHFRTDWASWRDIGRKACEATISDMAAMGGKPLWLLANLSSATSDHAPELLEGILERGIPLIGGDTTSSYEGATTLTLTVIGEAKRPVLRSGARAGDRIYVSGSLGGSRAGQISLEKGLGFAAAESRFLHPRARLDISESWGSIANSMIDISDGLSTELNHLSRMSGKRLRIDFAALPHFPGLASHGFDSADFLLSSGEEFELLATSSIPLPGGIEIGVVEEGEGVFAGTCAIVPIGFDHWRGE